jgi:hypothetical protein
MWLSAFWWVRFGSAVSIDSPATCAGGRAVVFHFENTAPRAMFPFPYIPSTDPNHGEPPDAEAAS